MKLSWKIYSFGYALFVLLSAVYSFFPESAVNVYYRILYAFQRSYFTEYLLHYAGAIIEIFCLVPLFLFAFEKKWLSPVFWKIVLFLRVLGLLSANFFEVELIKALLFANTFLTLLSLLIAFLILLPSYVALYIYAFEKQGSGK